MAVAREDIFEAGRRIEACIEGLSVSYTEDGFVLREEGKDPLFSKRVDATWQAHEVAGEYAAVGFYGESGKDNGYCPAVVSLIPETRWELASFLRFAVAAAFNRELKAGFMDD